MKRLLLVDNHTAFREAMALAIERVPELDVIGEANSLDSARQWFSSADVALIGSQGRDDHAPGLIRELLAANPGAKAVAIASGTDRRERALLVEAGACAIVQRSVGLDVLLDTVRKAASGKSFMTPEETIEALRFAAQVRDLESKSRANIARLTKRELEVMHVFTEGLSDAEIGRRLNISTETVRTHFANILLKLNLGTRLQVFAFAVRNGFCDQRLD